MAISVRCIFFLTYYFLNFGNVNAENMTTEGVFMNHTDEVTHRISLNLQRKLYSENREDGLVFNLHPFEFLTALSQFEATPKIIVIFEKTEDATNILQLVTEKCMSCLGIDRQSFLGFERNAINVTLLRIFFFKVNRREELHFVVLGGLGFYKIILEESQVQDVLLDQQGYYTFLHKWLFITTVNDMKYLQTYIKNTNNVVAITQNAVEKRLDIYTALWTRKQHSKNVPLERSLSFIGFYNNSGLEVFDTTLFPNSRNGFNSQHLLIGTQLWEGYNELRINAKDNSTYFYGSYVEVADYVAKRLNFTYSFVLPSDGMWGSKVNGSWNGIVKLAKDRIIDFEIAALISSSIRAEVMDFADFPLQYEYSLGVFKRPPPIENNLMLYGMPYSRTAWVAIILAFLTNGILIYGVSLLQYKILHKNSSCHNMLEVTEMDIIIHIRYLGRVYYNMFQSFFNQCVIENIIQRSAVKYLWQGWWLFSVFVTTLWTAMFISFIAVKIYPIPFKTLEDLPNQRKYSFGTLGDSNYELLLSTNKHVQYQKIWKSISGFYEKDKEVLSSTHSDHLQKVLQGNYIYLIDEISAKKLANKNCDVKIMNDPLFYDYYSIGMQKNSAYKQMVNNVTLELYDFGILDRLSKYYVLQGGSQCVYRNKDPIMLQFHHIDSVLFGTIIFLAIATLVFIIENVLFWYQQKYLRNGRDMSKYD